MNNTNIILTVIAIAFVVFIVWTNSSQKTPKINEPITNEPVSTNAMPTIEEPTTTEKIVTEIKNIKSMTIVTLTTNKGAITLELYADMAPKTVENFTKLASEGFYNGTRFHRVIKGFMIQGGDPLSKDVSNQNAWGSGGPGYQFADEIHADNKNNIGTISMANSGANTNGSQFFINVGNNNFLDTKHTVFGRVTAGMEIVIAIENTATAPGDRPLQDMIITKVEVK